MEFLCAFVATLATWALIEFVDALVSGFSLAWWASGLMSIGLVLGGVLIIILDGHSD